MEPNFAEKVYDEFMSFCSQALAKEDPKFLDIIKLRYEACSDEYRSSEKMTTLLKDTQRNMEMERSRLFVHLKDLVTELKAHSVHRKVKKRKREHVKQLSEDSDSDIQPHKSIKLLPCSVLIVKTEVTESDMSVAVPEKPKACWITTGISDSLQEISVANEIQQVSLFKELGYVHNDFSVKSLQSLNHKQKTSLDRKQVADSISAAKSTLSAGHSNSSTLIKTKTQGRKCTTIVNVGSSSVQGIQKINVASHLIARSLVSKNDSVNLAIRESEHNSSKDGNAAFEEGNSADGSVLGNNSFDRISTNSEQITCYGAISADGTQNKEIISSSSISDTTISNPSNESKMTFFQSLETGQDCVETSNLEKSLDIGVPDNCLLNKDPSSPLIATETSIIVTTGHSDFLDSTNSLVEIGSKVCPVEEVITKDISVKLTDCKQHSPLKSKRAVLTTLSSFVPTTSNKSFQSSSDLAEKSAKTLKADSKAQDSDDDFQDPQQKEVVNPKHQRHVKKLENLLESLRNEIEKCQSEELSLDLMDEETSPYIYEDKLKKKFVAAWNMLCKITKRSVTTGRPIERTVKFGGTRYKEINKRLERFLNKRKIFPDFADIKNIVKLTNKKYKMNLSSKSIDVISREAFVDIGEMLQHRRHQDFIATFGNRQTDFLRDSNTDPYLVDPELRRKLDSNRKVAKSNLDHVIAKYSKLQDEKADGIEEDSDDEEKEKTHRKTNKMLMEEDEENSDKDEQRSTCSECSHSSEKVQKEVRLSESPPAKSTYKFSHQKLNKHSCSPDTDLKSDSDDCTVKSFAKALGLNPLSLCLNNDDKLCGAQDDSSVTNESVIVLDGSPVKSGDKFPTLGKENYLASGSGQSSQDAILLKGPNIKFTARKTSTLSLSGRPEMSHSISYDDIAMENEEDQEDQSSESDCSGEEEDDDEDIMVIEDSVSEGDSESSRGASPISVISLSSSIDDIDDDDNLRPNAQLMEIKLEPTSDGVMNSRGQQNVSTCISHVLDLASSALLNQNATVESTLSQKLPTHSTEFLDLATSKSSRQGSISTTQIKHERRFVSPTESAFFSKPDNSVDISKSKKDLSHTFIPITPPEDTDVELLASQEKDVELDTSYGNKFKTNDFSEDKDVTITNHEDDFASADKVEITIEIDDESFDIGLPLAAENDSFISHQSKQKRGFTHPLNEDSVIDIDELSNDTKLFKDAIVMHAKKEKMSKSTSSPKDKVIVIDEASQHVSTSAQIDRICKNDNRIVSSCKNLFLENHSNQKSSGFSESLSLEEVIDLDASHNVKQFDSSRLDNGGDKSVLVPGISECLRSDSHRPTENVNECLITDTQQSSGFISKCHMSESHISVDTVNETGENLLPSSDCAKHPSSALTETPSTPMHLETFPDNPLTETSEISKIEDVSLKGTNPEKQIKTFHDSLHPNIANQNALIIAESTSELLNINFKDDKIVADLSVSLYPLANVNTKESTPEESPPSEEHFAIEVDKSKETSCDVLVSSKVVLKKIENNIEEVNANLNDEKSCSYVSLNLEAGGKVSEEKTKPRIDNKNLVLENCNTSKLEVIKGEDTNKIIDNNMEEINDHNTEEINDEKTEAINNENTEEINDDFVKLSVKNSEKINDENEKVNGENTEIFDDKNAEVIVHKNTEIIDDKSTQQNRDEQTETLNTEDTEKNEFVDQLSFKTIVEIVNDEKIEERMKDENVEKKNEDLELKCNVELVADQASDENLKNDSKSPAGNRKNENRTEKMANENPEATLLDVDTKQKQNDTDDDVLKDNAINVKNKPNEMINKDEKLTDSVAHKLETNYTAHNSEATPKSTSANLQEDCEDDDVFNSIFRICDEMIQNSAPEEKVIDHKLVGNVSQDEHSCPTENTRTNDTQEDGNVAEFTCSDLSKDAEITCSGSAKEEIPEVLVKEKYVLPTKDTEDCLVGQTTLEVVTDETDNSALSITPTTDLLANTDNSKTNTALLMSPTTGVTDKTDTKIPEKIIVDNDCDSENTTDKPQSGTCEDELEIIEELSNAVGRVQSKRTKEEDRLWVSQQLDKLNSTLSCQSSIVQPSHAESSDVTKCVADDTSSKNRVEEMPDLEDVECLDNETEEADGSKNALVSNSESTTSKTVAVKKRKKSSELEKFDSAEPAASTSKEKSSDVEIIGCENIAPPAKKHHIDTDFITELISSVYHEPLLNKAKKPKPTSTGDDEDVQVVETNTRPRILRQEAPSMKNSKAIRGQDVVKNYTAIRGNKMSTVSTRVNSTYLGPSSRGQFKNVSRFSSAQIQTSQRLASNSTPYNAKRMPNPLPCLGPRVPIPRIQPPSSFGSPRLNSRSFQMNSPPRSFSNPGAMFPNRQKFVDKRMLVSPYFRSSSSTSSPVRQSSPNIRQQRSPSHTAGRGRPFQMSSMKNTRQPARNLDGTEIVLDDSDTEDQNSNPSTTPVILSVQSLSSVNASKETKSPSVKKPGDVIVLSDSD